MSVQRSVVLDTNVVLDLFHFDDALTRPLRHALETGALRAAASEATFGEWLRVLTYPAFGLSVAHQAGLAARYRAVCAISEGLAATGAPPCRDPDDQKFLDLAARLRVPLVSKDRAVLRLRRRCAPQFTIFTPAEVVAWLDTVQA